MIDNYSILFQSYSGVKSVGRFSAISSSFRYSIKNRLSELVKAFFLFSGSISCLIRLSKKCLSASFLLSPSWMLFIPSLKTRVQIRAVNCLLSKMANSTPGLFGCQYIKEASI